MEKNVPIQTGTQMKEMRTIKIGDSNYKYSITKMKNEKGIIVSLFEVKPKKNISFIYKGFLNKLTKEIKFLRICENLEEMITSLKDIFNRGKITVEIKDKKYIMTIEVSLLGKITKYEIEIERHILISEKNELFLKLNDMDNKFARIEEEIYDLKNNMNYNLKKMVKEELNKNEIAKEILHDKEMKQTLFNEFEGILYKRNNNRNNKRKNEEEEIISKKINEYSIKQKYSIQVDGKSLNENINKLREEIDNYKNEINSIKNNIEYMGDKINNYLNKKTNKNNTFERFKFFGIKEEEVKNNMNKTMGNLVQREEYNNIFSKTKYSGIMCHNCGITPIIGIGYKCFKCPRNDQCQNCFQKNNNKTPKPKNDFYNVANVGYDYDIKEKDQGRFIQIVYMEEYLDISFEFTIINSGKLPFPGEGRTKFTVSNLIPDIIIETIDPLDSQIIYVNIPRNKMSLGERILKLNLNIDGKDYGNPINLIIIVKSLNVQRFLSEFNLEERNYNEQNLYDILKRNKFNFRKTFDELFD